MTSETIYEIWTDSFEGLLGRWAEMAEPGPEPLPSASELLSRVRRRVAAVQKQCGLPRRKPIAIESWTSGRFPAEEEKLLLGALRALGWRVSYAVGVGGQHDALLRPGTVEGSVLVVEQDAVLGAMRRYASLQVPVAFTERDALCLQLAEELYSAAVDDIGLKPAEEWVDDLGSALFIQEVLAWPISPLAVMVLEMRGH